MPRLLHAVSAPLVLTSLVPSSLAQHVTYSDRSSAGYDDVAITPDGRYAVARSRDLATRSLVIELATGTVVVDYPSAPAASVPRCLDGVEVTNERAVTIGSRVVIFDLATPAPNLLSETDCGAEPRDVEITPDGRFAVVRGGSGPRGGAHVFELAFGSEVFFQQLDVQDPVTVGRGNDLVATTAEHGVVLGFDAASGTTRVVVLELDPPGGAGPRVVFQSNATDALVGRPMDVAVTPDGRFASVRSEDELALFRLNGSATSLLRTSQPWPATTSPFGEIAVDSVLMSDELIATITIGQPGVAGGYLSLQSIPGANWFATLDGAPRDLVMTPDRSRLFVHTSEALYDFDLTGLDPTGGAITADHVIPMLASSTGLETGRDSVECTNEVLFCQYAGGGLTWAVSFDLTSGPAPRQIRADLVSGEPRDLALSSDGRWAMSVTPRRYMVFDLRSPSIALIGQVNGPQNVFALSDSAAIHPDHAVASHVFRPNQNGGWLDTIDLVSRESVDCAGLPNGMGRQGELYALGSTRVVQNDLELRARALPSGQVGVFFLGAANPISAGSGARLCVSGRSVRFDPTATTSAGTAFTSIDLTSGPVGSLGIGAGSTWYAQFFHRDPGTASGIASTNSIALLFE